MDVKFRVFNVALENCQTTQVPLEKSPDKISFSPGITCLCKVMINGKFDLKLLKALENSNQGLTPWNSILSGKAWDFTSTPRYGYKLE